MRTSVEALAAFLAGLLSLVCGLVALLFGPDPFLIGVVLFGVLSFVLGARSWRAINDAPGDLCGKAFAGWGVGIAVGGVVLGLLVLPAAWMFREATSRMGSICKLKQIVLAMHSYADEHHGQLPPAVLYDKMGRPLHSWRVLILPYMEGQDLYEQFRLDEPWDSPHNLALLPCMPSVYDVPSNLPFEVQAEPFTTFYQVFVGNGTAFEKPQGPHIQRDFPNGRGDTIILVEAGKAVPWTKPADVVYAADQPLPPLGGIFMDDSQFRLLDFLRYKGFHVAMADASVQFQAPTFSEADLRKAITRNDGKPD